MNPNRTPESPRVPCAAANPLLHAYFFGIGPSGSTTRAPLPGGHERDASGPSRTTPPDTAFPRDAANDDERTR